MTVAREGTFTKAAQQLFITQPSLSEQVRKLEAELGSPLFERLGRTLTLTSAGEAFLPHAERALQEVDRGRLRVEDVRGLKVGRLTIGVLASVAARLLPRFMAEFQRKHTAVEVVLSEEMVSSRIEDMVHAAELDLGIVRLPKSRVDLEQKFLLRERMVLVVPPDHRLAERHSVGMADLAREPFVSLKRGFGLRELLVQQAHGAGFEPNVVFETTQIGSVVGLVLAGLGVTVLPEMAAFSVARLIPIRDREAYRDVGVVWRQGQPLAPAANAFLSVLRTSPMPERARG